MNEKQKINRSAIREPANQINVLNTFPLVKLKECRVPCQIFEIEYTFLSYLIVKLDRL